MALDSQERMSRGDIGGDSTPQTGNKKDLEQSEIICMPQEEPLCFIVSRMEEREE
jgi:hypothetical protein